jgi:hypothetical protein
MQKVRTELSLAQVTLLVLMWTNLGVGLIMVMVVLMLG